MYTKVNKPKQASNPERAPLVNVLSDLSHDRKAIKLFPVRTDDEMRVPIVIKINQVDKLLHSVFN